MNAIHKKALQNNHTALVDSLDFQRTHLLDHLYSDGSLSAGDIEEIDVRKFYFVFLTFLFEFSFYLTILKCVYL